MIKTQVHQKNWRKRVKNSQELLSLSEPIGLRCSLLSPTCQLTQLFSSMEMIPAAAYRHTGIKEDRFQSAENNSKFYTHRRNIDQSEPHVGGSSRSRVPFLPIVVGKEKG